MKRCLSCSQGLGNPLKLSLHPVCVKSQLCWVIEGARNDVNWTPSYNEQPLACHYHTTHSFFVCVRFSFIWLTSYYFFIWMHNLFIISTTSFGSNWEWQERHGISSRSLKLSSMCLKVLAGLAGLIWDHFVCIVPEMKTCLTSLRERWFPPPKCWNKRFSSVGDMGFVLLHCRQADSCACACVCTNTCTGMRKDVCLLW